MDHNSPQRAAGVSWQRYGAPDAPAVIVLHGLFGSGDNWRSHAKLLADQFAIWIADVPNHGQSDRLEDASYPAVADRLWRSIDKLQLDAVAIVGHSMGGKIAMTMALDRPQRVTRLVVVDIAPTSYPVWHSTEIEGLKAVVDQAPYGRSAAEQVLARYIDDQAIRRFLLKSWAPSADGGYHLRVAVDVVERCYASIAGWPERSAHYHGPTLVIAGERSEYVKVEHTALFERHFADLQITTLPGAGHWLHAEKPTEFLAAVRAFLRPASGGSDG